MAVRVDDDGVHGDGESVAWADLGAVAIRTTDRGPFVDDFHWILTRRDGTVLVVPSDPELLARLQRLPGFDNEALVRASASVVDGVFPCWRLRSVALREEHHGEDRRFLAAYVDAAGALHIDGHDLGPGTAMVSADGEYEWHHTIAAADVPRLVELVGGRPGDDVLDVLERDWTGRRSYDLEALLRHSDIPVDRWVWGG